MDVVVSEGTVEQEVWGCSDFKLKAGCGTISYLAMGASATPRKRKCPACGLTGTFKPLGIARVEVAPLPE